MSAAAVKTYNFSTRSFRYTNKSYVQQILFDDFKTKKKNKIYKVVVSDQNHLAVGFSIINRVFFFFLPDIVNPTVVGRVLSAARSENPKLRNVANVFLTDFCTERDVQAATEIC